MDGRVGDVCVCIGGRWLERRNIRKKKNKCTSHQRIRVKATALNLHYGLLTNELVKSCINIVKLIALV